MSNARGIYCHGAGRSAGSIAGIVAEEGEGHTAGWNPEGCPTHSCAIMDGAAKGHARHCTMSIIVNRSGSAGVRLVDGEGLVITGSAYVVGIGGNTRVEVVAACSQRTRAHRCSIEA